MSRENTEKAEKERAKTARKSQEKAEKDEKERIKTARKVQEKADKAERDRVETARKVQEKADRTEKDRVEKARKDQDKAEKVEKDRVESATKSERSRLFDAVLSGASAQSKGCCEPCNFHVIDHNGEYQPCKLGHEDSGLNKEICADCTSSRYHPKKR
jgi:hypothetical protein